MMADKAEHSENTEEKIDRVTKEEEDRAIRENAKKDPYEVYCPYCGDKVPYGAEHDDDWNWTIYSGPCNCIVACERTLFETKKTNEGLSAAVIILGESLTSKTNIIRETTAERDRLRGENKALFGELCNCIDYLNRAETTLRIHDNPYLADLCSDAQKTARVVLAKHGASEAKGEQVDVKETKMR